MIFSDNRLPKSLLLITVTISLFATLTWAADKPNIVILLADDLGWKDVSFHGAEFPTPNIDRIAREGVELDRYYVTPICTPTRAGLLTGRYPLRFGLQRVTVKSWGTRTIPDDEVLIPASLETAGYKTRAMTGKWHLGWKRRANHPMEKGFTSFWGHSGGAIGYFTHTDQGLHDWHRNYELNYEPGYSTELIGDEAVRVIEEAENDPSPFFLYVAFNAIHTPNDVLPRHLALFTHIQDKGRREKAAMMTSLDEQVGRILDALDRTKASENTLVLFSSDNGGGIPAGSVNLPLRDGKWAVYEGGIRVAAALRWPAGIQGGRKLTEPISFVDIYPTLLGITGAKSSGKPFDGEDVLDVLRGKKKRNDFEFHSYFQGQKIPQNADPNREIPFERNAVNTREWKLVRLGPALHLVDDPVIDAFIELYKIREDPYEENDIADKHPRIVSKLVEKMVAFRATQKPELDHVDIQPPASWVKPLSKRIPNWINEGVKP
jgi:arylsulfatase B